MEPQWSPEDEEQAKAFAQKVVDRGMALPAILFLESVRPLHFIGGQFMHFVAPISGLVVGRWDLDRVGNFLEHRGAVPFVINEIQRRDKRRADQSKAGKRRSRRRETPTQPELSAKVDDRPGAPGADPKDSRRP